MTRILVAEDDHVSQLVIMAMLKPYGQVEAADNGIIAVNKFQAAWEQEDPFELVCLDLMMPEMGGQEALRLIREFETINEIPAQVQAKIVITTALSDQENFIAAIKNGSEWYLNKPIERQKLDDVLAEFGFTRAQKGQK